LVGEFYNSSLSVELISNVTLDVDFFISSYNAPRGILELKLNFNDPLKISRGVVSNPVLISLGTLKTLSDGHRGFNLWNRRI
jgi:hypothetical protein